MEHHLFQGAVLLIFSLLYTNESIPGSGIQFDGILLYLYISTVRASLHVQSSLESLLSDYRRLQLLDFVSGMEVRCVGSSKVQRLTSPRMRYARY